MTTDFRALCAELHAAFTTYAVDECHHDLLEHTRAALADEPAVPEGREPVAVTEQPSDEELESFLVGVAAEYGDIYPWTDPLVLVRAVLARWGNPAPQPVPVSERLPGPEDCDAEGRCWFLRFPFDYSRESWSLEDRTYGCNTGFTHWLPAHALPIPQQQQQQQQQENTNDH